MDRLTQDAERMLEIMERTANSDSNGWQYIYWIAVAVFHILEHINRHKQDWRLP